MTSPYRRFVVLIGFCLAATLAAGTAESRVSGSVLLDDGMPPADAISIELVCQGRTVSRTEASGEHGRFEIPEFPPKSRARDCLVRASLPGYRADTVPVNQLPGSPEVAALVLYRKGKWQGAAISATWLAAPDSARQAFDTAIRELRRGGEGDLEKTTEALRTAVSEYPEYAAAWHELGALLLAAGDTAAAHDALLKAVEADPWFITPYEPLIIMAMAEERWEEVRTLCDHLLTMNPYLVDAHYHRGVSSLHLDDVDGARRAVKAIEDGPEAETYALLHHLKGLLLEREGDFQAAAAEYWRAVSADPDIPVNRKLRRLLGEWQAEGKISEPPW